MGDVTPITGEREIHTGDNNGNGSIRERVKALETELKHLATKEDVLKIKLWVLLGVIGAVPVTVMTLMFVAKYIVN